MALRSIWKGVIRFGMVVIPVNLYNATEEKTIHFHQVHGECGSRIQQPRYCPKCERRIEPREEIKRGYEIAKNQDLILEEADFERLPLKTLHTIEIKEFAPADRIDSIRYERSYFISPEELGVKPFALLLRAIEKTNLVAIAKLVYRNKELLSAVRAYNGILLLHPLYYEDELRDFRDLKPGRVTISEKELSVAIDFINCLKTEKLSLAKYHDEYREALMKVIEAKQAKEAIPVAPAAEPTKVPDLAEVLMASIQAAQKAKPKRRKEAVPASVRPA